MKQGSKVQLKATGRVGTVESGMPFMVSNRKYVEVRWEDDGKVSNVGVWKLAPVR